MLQIKKKENDMPVRSARAQWNGGFPKGDGSLKLGSGSFEGAYSFSSRFENGQGTNPEELIGAAEAGCFSMALGKMLTDAGHTPEYVRTDAKVHMGKSGDDFAITTIELETEVKAPVDENTIKEKAEQARKGCIVSRALQGVEIKLNARLV
jgi:osmotically inducible protein OsmC